MRKLVAVCLVSCFVAGAACRSQPATSTTTSGTTSGTQSGSSSTARPKAGGSLVASVRGEPRSFSRLAARDSTTVLLSELTQAKLLRVNRMTDEIEPWLAEGWSASDDGRRY